MLSWLATILNLQANSILELDFMEDLTKYSGQHPQLAWSSMQVKSRTVLMYGLEHFVRTPTFAHVQNLDFSSVQLETDELKLLCGFCSKNNYLKSVNLSDKVENMSCFDKISKEIQHF